MRVPIPPFLTDQSLRLLAFGGKGGVGKTTCAAASALYLSKTFPPKTFLIVSTDPAHSLQDSLADLTPPDNLTTIELDATRSLTAFRERHTDKLRQIASRGTFLDDEDINQFLALSLPGLDELMAFLEILDWVDEGRYDVIIIDTAPTGHTLRLLQMPEFFKKWLEALDALLGKHRYMKKVFSGSYQSDEVDEFLLDLSRSVESMGTFLQDPQRYCFVPVMIAEDLSIKETIDLLQALAGLKTPLHDILVNRLLPENGCPVCRSGRASQIRELACLEDRFSDYSLWGIPMYPSEVRGHMLLESFWDRIWPIEHPLPKSPEASSMASPLVEWSSSRPAVSKSLLLFGGKGGVGKTTLSCAAAVYLSQTAAEKEVLLFSTDPAHSLSACLEVEIGSTPVRIASRLTAVEINGQEKFESLTKQYRAELETFLLSISPKLDLAFDREVMERIMDLSPPGIDEIMALTVAMEFADKGQYDILVLDAAPTGHLMRLLEMPELIEQWLKVFFNLFLKYKQIFRLPGISRRLVDVSKDVKKFRRLLGSAEDSSLFVVSILTQMAFEETQDLLKTCDRTGVRVPALILNMATPKSCALCSALFLHESDIRRKFQQTYPQMSQALIYRQGEYKGLARLGELGKALCEPESF